MSLRDESIALLCRVEPWPYGEVETRKAIELHPDGLVAHQVARVEARLSDLLRRQREACAGAAVKYIAGGIHGAGHAAILAAEVK